MNECPNNKLELPDIQKTTPQHCLPIQRVGITNLKIPIFIREQNEGYQHTVADVDVFVNLQGDSKGTHMSRLAIGVQQFLTFQLDSNIIAQICEYTRQSCDAQTAQVIYRFPYFIKKSAPISNEPGLVHCNVIFNTTTSNSNGCIENKDVIMVFEMSVEIFATSLCPCSKEISNAGAHNQRSRIKITCQTKNFVWIEDLIDIAEKSAACQIYSVLKREDEKWVTETAYNNPGFVEDIARECYYRLLQRDDLANFEVEVRNEESIHTHDAYAKMSFNR